MADKIKIPILEENPNSDPVFVQNIDCEKGESVSVDPGYGVVYPVKSGVFPGKGKLVPLSGGALVKFITKGSSGLKKKIDDQDAANLEISRIKSLILESISTGEGLIEDINSPYSSSYLKKRLKLQKALFGYTVTDSLYPRISIGYLKSQNELWKEQTLSKFSDLEKITLSLSNFSDIDDAGSFKYLSIDCILAILEEMIDETYMKATRQNGSSIFYPLIKSNSGISLFSIYLSLTKHLNKTLSKKTEYLEGKSEQGYLNSSDLKTYCDKSNLLSWEDNAPIDFIMQEIFGFLIPYYKVYDFDNSTVCGIYTLIDKKLGEEEVSIGYAKFPDLSFEESDGEFDYSDINFGLKKENDTNNLVNEEYSDKTFLTLKYSVSKFGGENSCDPLRYLPAPKANLTPDGGENFQSGKLDLNNNITLSIDVKDIIGGEAESFGLEEAPDFKDYFGRISVVTPSNNFEEKKTFSFMNGGFTKDYRATEIDMFSFPNNIGGIAIDPDFKITLDNPEAILADRFYPSGNFNIALLEVLSRMGSSLQNDVGEWNKRYYKAIKSFHESNIAPISKEKYLTGSDSKFFKPSLESGKGLSADISKSLSSYRAYFMSNGIPNTEEFVGLFGFSTLQDFLNFNGNLSHLFFLYEEDDENKLSSADRILQENSVIKDEDGILLCRPRIADNSSNIIAEHLNSFSFEDLAKSSDSVFPDDANNLLVSVRSKSTDINNTLDFSKQKTYYTFYTIDRLGQFRTSNVQISIKQIDDLSDIKISSNFGDTGLDVSKPLNIDLEIKDPGEISTTQDVLVSVYSDPEATSLIGSEVLTATISSPGIVSLASSLPVSEVFGIPEDTTGLVHFVFENNYSASFPQAVPINEALSVEPLEYDEISFVSKNTYEIPISKNGDLAKIFIKSKNSRLEKDFSVLRFYYVAEVSNADEEDVAIREFLKFSFPEDIKALKISGEDKERTIILSKSLSTRISGVSKAGFGFRSGKLGEVEFPPKDMQDKNIGGLKNIKKAGLLTIITGNDEVPFQPTSDKSILSGSYKDLPGIEFGNLQENFSYQEIAGTPFVSTPNILEMAIKAGGSTTTTSNSENIKYLKSAKKINSGFDFNNISTSSNLEKRSGISFLIAIEGIGYKKSQLDFLMDVDGKLRKLDQPFFSFKKQIQEISQDGGPGVTVVRLNSVSFDEDIQNLNLVFALKSKKYNATFLSKDMISDSFSLNKEEFRLENDGIFKLLYLNEDSEILFGDELKTFGSVKNSGKDLIFNRTKRYHLNSNNVLQALSVEGVNSDGSEKTRLVNISERGSDFPYSSIDIPEIGSFPPSIPKILDVITPDVSFEVEVDAQTGEASVSLGITNPLEIYTNVSLFSGLSDVPDRVLGGSNSYVASKYFGHIKDLKISKEFAIYPRSYYLNSDETKAIVSTNISIKGKSYISFFDAKPVSALVGEKEVSLEELSSVVTSGVEGGVVTLVFDGKVDEGMTVTMGGHDLPSSIEGNLVHLSVNESVMEEVSLSSDLIGLSAPLTLSTDPCTPIIGDKQDSAAKKTKADPRRFAKGFEEKYGDIISGDSDNIDLEEIFEKLDFMEIGYANNKIRKPIGATKEAIRSICDLSFHMTAELRASLRGFKNLLVIIKVIFCIIDVICALGNPVKLGPAIIKLFLCLFDLLLLLPQLAVPISLLKLLSHSFELLTCLIVKVLKTYVALSEIANAIDEAYRLKDYESLVKLEKVLNRHVLSIEADLSVLDPILDILELFQELLGFAVAFPCNSSDGGELFGVCGASDNVVCNVIIGKVTEGSEVNTKCLIPVSQSYSIMGADSLTLDQNGGPTLNCGNTPPDDLDSDTRAEDCFGSDDVNGIFVEPKYADSNTQIISLEDFDSENVDTDSYRFGDGLEATYQISVTQIKKNNVFDGTFINGDTRDCIFEFNYKGKTSSLAFNKFIHWIFPKITINTDKTSDSPIIPLREDGGAFFLDKNYSNGIKLWNPHTMEGYELKGNVEDGFEIPKYKLKYDVNGEEFVDQDHKLPQVVIVDDRLHVYRIERIYVEGDDVDSEKFGIYKIKAKRVGYPSFESYKFSKEEEMYIADPKIHYADLNYSKIKSLLEIDTSETEEEEDFFGRKFDVPTNDAVLNMASAIWLFDKNDNNLYGNFGIVPLESAIYSKNISGEDRNLISHEGIGVYAFKGGAIFKQVYDRLHASPNPPPWAFGGTNTPAFLGKKSEFISAFEEGGGLYENFGSFPFTSYVHKSQTLRDPTQPYLDAFSKSIGESSTYDFPTIFLFDMSSIADELKTICENNSAMNSIVDKDAGAISDIVSEAQDCFNKLKTAQRKRFNDISKTLSEGKSLLDLDFIKNPNLPAIEAFETQNCVQGIIENKLCDFVIDPLATEFLVLEDSDFTPRDQYIGANTSILGADEQGIGSLSLTGATKYANGIGDNGEFFVDEEITIRVIPRHSDDSILEIGNYDFSGSFNLSVIEDTGGSYVMVKDFEKVIFVGEDENGNPIDIQAYDAIIKSPVKSEIEVVCGICNNMIAAQIPLSVQRSFKAQGIDVGCNNDPITLEQITGFAQLSQTPRVLSISVIDRGSKESDKEYDSTFNSNSSPATFGSQG